MTVGEAIKQLKKNNFIELNQIGSHIKFGRNNDRITIVKHKSDKEELNIKTVKDLKKLINGSNIKI